MTYAVLHICVGGGVRVFLRFESMSFVWLRVGAQGFRFKMPERQAQVYFACGSIKHKFVAGINSTTVSLTSRERSHVVVWGVEFRLLACFT